MSQGCWATTGGQDCRQPDQQIATSGRESVVAKFIRKGICRCQVYPRGTKMKPRGSDCMSKDITCTTARLQCVHNNMNGTVFL